MRAYGLDKWRHGIQGKVSLRNYSLKLEPSKEKFYNGNWASSLLFKARTNSLELRSRVYRFEGNGDKTCLACNMGCEETVHHIIVECQAYEEVRVSAIADYVGSIGRDKFNRVISREDDGLNYFLGLGEDINTEVVEITKSLLLSIWTIRASVID